MRANTIIFILLLLISQTDNALAKVTITGPKVLCQGGFATLSAPSGMRRYLWSDGATTQSTTVFMPGRYTVVVTDSNNAIDSGTYDLPLGFNPKPRIGNPQEYLCEGDELNLEAPDYYRSYRWSTGDTTNQIRVQTSGTYWLSVVDTNGCAGTSDAVEVIIVPFPSFTINGPASSCRSSTVTYTTTNDTGIVYTWTVDGGTIVGGQGTSSAQITWNRSGSVSVRAVRQRPDGGYCNFDTSLFVRVGARLVPEILYGLSSFCTGDSVTLSISGNYKWVTWSTGETSTSITVRSGGNYWVQAEDSSGCAGISDTLPVTEYPRPNVAIAGTKILCVGQSGTLTATSAANDVMFWKWNTGATTNSITVSTGGTYSVIGTTINACVDTAFITVVVAGTIDVSLNDIDYGTVSTGIPVTALLQVDNNGSINVSVMSITSPAAEITTSPIPPRLLPVGGGETFRVTWTPQMPGPFSTVLTLELMSADCAATITCNVKGIAIGDPPVGTVLISIPDTTVDVGVNLDMPVTIVPNTSVIDDVLSFDITFDPGIYSLNEVVGATITITSFDTESKTITLSLPFRGGTDTTFVMLKGMVMLATPFTTPLHIADPKTQNTPVIFALDDGSITERGCWLPGRLVSVGDVAARVVISTINGAVVYDARHNKLSDDTLHGIVDDLRLARQPLFVVLLGTNGELLYSATLFNE